MVLEELIKRHKRRIEAGEFTPEMLEFTRGMERLILLTLGVNYDKRFERASMPFSDSHRAKVRAWQTLVVLLDFLDPRTVYRPDRRASIKELLGTDIVTQVNKELWGVIGLNHLPTVRTYIEIVMIRFSLQWPSLSIEDPRFVKTLLDPNVKQTVASSYLTIAGFVMTRLDALAAQENNGLSSSGSSFIQLKERLLQHMSGFLTSNGAHVRCVAQYFMHLIALDPNMSKSQFNFITFNRIEPFVPEGL